VTKGGKQSFSQQSVKAEVRKLTLLSWDDNGHLMTCTYSSTASFSWVQFGLHSTPFVSDIRNVAAMWPILLFAVQQCVQYLLQPLRNWQQFTHLSFARNTFFNATSNLSDIVRQFCASSGPHCTPESDLCAVCHRAAVCASIP
jgi:hypothetical protein